MQRCFRGRGVTHVKREIFIDTIKLLSNLNCIAHSLPTLVVNMIAAFICLSDRFNSPLRFDKRTSVQHADQQQFA